MPASGCQPVGAQLGLKPERISLHVAVMTWGLHEHCKLAVGCAAGVSAAAWPRPDPEGQARQDRQHVLCFRQLHTALLSKSHCNYQTARSDASHALGRCKQTLMLMS